MRGIRLKKFLLIIFLIFNFFATASAEKIKVAVMDFGQYSGAITGEINSENIGAMASDYLIEALVESGYFEVISKELFEEKFAEEKISTAGIISPGKAKKISEILGVRYLIYGNVNSLGSESVSLEIFGNGGKFNSVKAKIIPRMMDATNGDIVGMVSGEGVSKSSEVKISPTKFITIKIGSYEVPQICVHNSIKKAAYNSVDAMIEQLFDIKIKNKRR